MKEKLTAIFLFIIFLLFFIYEISLNKEPTVLKVITPTILQIDLNNNNIVDDNENICVANIETFTSNLQKFSDEITNTLSISPENAIAVGYLTDEFANKTVLGKKVKIKFTNQLTPECRWADVYIDDKSYANTLYEKGFGIKNHKDTNKPEFKKVLDKAKNLKLVIVNHKSNKYHNLNCKYGRIAHDSVVILEKDLPKDSKPCKFCHLTKYEKKQVEKHKTIITPPSIATDGNFKLILTDFTTILKPDKNCTHQVCKEFVSLINSSNKSIDIALYGWSDIDKVNKALTNAQKRGVKIRIVYDTATNKANYYPETESFIKRYETTRSDKIDGNKKLTNMLMHNKFAIFDNQKVYTGSMNFSTTGLSGFNHNNVVVINSKNIAEIYEKEFTQMLEGKFHTIKQKSEHNTNITTGNTSISVYFSPQDKGITNGIIPIIKHSKKYIYIPTFILTHNELFQELINAQKRGVDIKIIIDATSVGVTHSKIKLLRTSGIPVKTENFAGKMHAKSMIIDDEYVIVGSANFSSSGENKNDENMLIIKNRKFAKLYKDFFEYFWQKIPDKYLKYNVSAESKYSIGSCSDGVDNDFDGKIDFADEGCQKKSK